MRIEKMVLNQERNVTLTAYLLEVEGEFGYVSRRPAILVLPGGGYRHCSDREADPVAMPYLQAGYQVFILRYSVKEYAAWPNPLEDYEQAMTLIRENADKWTLFPDKVAVIGFSAGGHLAAAAATMSVNRPNAAILGYAVVSSDVKGCNATAPDTVSQVDKDTCPCFLFATRNDEVVPVMNSIRFMEALAKMGTSFESHIYSHGPHGFSTGDTSIQCRDVAMSCRISDWVPDSIGWLKEVLGDFGENGITSPAVEGHVTGDWKEFLSIECTFGRIMSNPEGRRVIEEMLETMKKQAEGSGQGKVEVTVESMAAFSDMKLKNMLGHVRVPEDMVRAMEDRLSQIPNL